MYFSNKITLAAVALAGSVAAYNPYGASDSSLLARHPDAYLSDLQARGLDYAGDDESDLFAREADFELDDDHLSDIYSRDLMRRNLQIRDDLHASIRLQELFRRDPELYEMHKRGFLGKAAGGFAGWKAAGAMGGGWKSKVVGAVAGAWGGNKLQNHFSEKSHEGGDSHEGGASPMRKRFVDEDPELFY